MFPDGNFRCPINSSYPLIQQWLTTPIMHLQYANEMKYEYAEKKVINSGYEIRIPTEINRSEN